MYFDDKARKIDFILAWSIKPNKKSIEAQRARELFENNLKQEGLELEYDKVSGLTSAKSPPQINLFFLNLTAAGVRS